MKKIVIAVFIIHFSVIVVSVLDNIHVIPQNLITDLSKLYTTPFFEQNWGMFSNPPTTTKRIYFQFHKHDQSPENIEITDWYDINDKIYSYNKEHFFSVAQRLIKYESGCLNSIYQYIEKCKDPTPDKCIEQAPGFISLRNYARIIYKNSIDADLQDKQNTKFVIKVVEEHFPRFKDRKLDYSDKKNFEYATYETIPYDLF